MLWLKLDEMLHAHAILAQGGSPYDFALSLRHEGYKNITDFRVVDGEGGNNY